MHQHSLTALPIAYEKDLVQSRIKTKTNKQTRNLFHLGTPESEGGQEDLGEPSFPTLRM